MPGSLEVADPNRLIFPLAAAFQYEAFVAAGGSGVQRDRTWEKHWKWGIARAPLELIAHIVEEDRNYQEVVTADYMMVNYKSNEFLNAGASFDSEDPTVFKPGQNNGQIIRDELLVSEFTQKYGVNIFSYGPSVYYPTAGVLNTHAFLNRYPSTETNRNRARARWTYLQVFRSRYRSVSTLLLTLVVAMLIRFRGSLGRNDNAVHLGGQ